MSSLYVIFVHNYRRKKQTFVKVIWLLVSLSEINLAVALYIIMAYVENESLSFHHRIKVLHALEWI